MNDSFWEDLKEVVKIAIIGSIGGLIVGSIIGGSLFLLCHFLF